MSAADREETFESSPGFREDTIEQLRAMLAGRGDGIELDTPFHSAIEDLKQPVPFFEHLPILLPPDSILYVKGMRIASDVAAFYSAHRARNGVDVARDTIAPAPDIYHFSFSPDVASRLRQFAENRPVADIGDDAPQRIAPVNAGRPLCWFPGARGPERLRSTFINRSEPSDHQHSCTLKH